MESRFRAVLPKSAVGLVDSIESICQCEIDVRQDSDLLPQSDRSPLACTITEDARPVILVRTEADFQASGAVHELLHLERYLVLGIPQLQPAIPEVGPLLDQMEDILEHLVIIPKGGDYGFDHFPDAESQARRDWEKIDSEQLDSVVGRSAALLHFLPVHFLGKDPALKAHAHEVLRARDHGVDAAKMVMKLSRQLDQKAAATSTLIRFMKFPPRQFVRLVYFDARSRRLRWEEVPEHS